MHRAKCLCRVLVRDQCTPCARTCFLHKPYPCAELIVRKTAHPVRGACTGTRSCTSPLVLARAHIYIYIYIYIYIIETHIKHRYTKKMPWPDFDYLWRHTRYQVSLLSDRISDLISFREMRKRWKHIL